MLEFTSVAFLSCSIQISFFISFHKIRRPPDIFIHLILSILANSWDFYQISKFHECYPFHLNPSDFNITGLRVQKAYSHMGISSDCVHVYILLLFAHDSWLVWHSNKDAYMHKQIWCTHCQKEVPEWVHTFWTSKPVIFPVWTSNINMSFESF